MVNPQVIRLEALRQELQGAEQAAGRLSDYIDRGNPSAQQQREAFAQMALHERRAENLRLQLGERLAALRTSEPQVVEQWVGLHIRICERIIAEEEEKGEAELTTRLYVARKTREEWEKVLDGTQDYVSINAYFLRDYCREVAALVAEEQG